MAEHSEKGDLGLSNDEVSLPPHYAPPSEVFTDSPPPAYQRKNAPIVRVARMVCLTAFAITFLIGFFIIAHKYIVTSHKFNLEEVKNVNTVEKFEFTEDLKTKPSPLVQGASLVSIELDNGKIENDIEGKEKEIEEFLEPIPEPEVATSTEGQEDENILDMQELPEEPIVDPFKNPLEMMNRFNLPFGDIFNPSKDLENNPNCKVKKQNRNIGPGMTTSLISIVCDGDENENDSRELPMLPPAMLPPGARRVEPPMDLLNTILKVLSSGKPNSSPLEGKKLIKMIPFPGSNSMIPPAPIRGETIRIPPPMAGDSPRPAGFPLKLNMIPFGKIRFRPREQDERRNGNQQLPPIFKKMPLPGPFPFPMGDDDLPPFIRQSLPPNVEIIRMSRPMDSREEEDNMPLRPFPMGMHPIMKLMPSRKGRVIRLKPQMNEMNGSPFPFGFPENMIFPQQNDHIPHPMPEASGRALPDPVALPEMKKILRLPFRPHFENFPFGPRMIELRDMQSLREESPFRLSPFQKVNSEFEEPRDFFQSLNNHHDDSHFPFTPHHEQNNNHIEHPGHYNSDEMTHPHGPIEDVEEFGPPRTHTLMQHGGHPVFGSWNSPHQGRNQNELNDDSDFHTHADGVSHSHPHNGPHTHIGGEIFPLNIEDHSHDDIYHSHAHGMPHSNSHDVPQAHNIDEMMPLNLPFQRQETDQNFQMHDNGFSNWDTFGKPQIYNDDDDSFLLNEESDPNFHTHDNGMSHSHPNDGPHNHHEDDFVSLNENFHSHDNGMSHNHAFDVPHTHHEDGFIIPLNEESDSNFHTHDNGMFHSHPNDGPHNHNGDDFILLNEESDPNFHTHDNGMSHSHPNDGPHNHNEDDFITLNTFQNDQLEPNFNTYENSDPNEDILSQNEDFFISEPSFENDYIDEPEEEPTFIIDDTVPMFDEQPENPDQSVFKELPQPEEPFSFETQPHMQTEQELSDAQSDYLPLDPDYETQPEKFIPRLPEGEPSETEVIPEEPSSLPQDISDIIDARGNVPDDFQIEPEVMEDAPEEQSAPIPLMNVNTF